MSKIRYRLLGGAAAAVLTALAPQAFAQDAPISIKPVTVTVNELVITGRSLEETLPAELYKIGHDVVLVPGETIRDKNYIDTTAALQFEVPGLYAAQSAGPFSYTYISLQGSRQQDVLWTVDGVRINNRLYSTTPPDTLPASMISRIEVLKGGESLFYGTQGVAGVINVVTHPFSTDFGGSVTVGGDSNSGVHVDGLVRGAMGGHRYVAFASHDQSDGFEAYDVFQPSATLRERGYEVTSGGLKYGYDFTDDLSLNATYIHTDAKLDYPGARLTNFSQNRRDEDIVSVKLDYVPDEGLQFFVKGYHHTWDSRYTTINNVIGSPGTTVVVDDDLYWGYKDTGLNLLGLLPVGGVDLLAGYDFQTYEARDEVLIIEQVAEEVHAVFGQIRTNNDFSERGRIAAGFRYNKTGEETATVWNVSGRYDINSKVFVQGNVGTAFTLPTAENLFAVDPFSTFGNPFLEPEESTNLNASIGGVFSGGGEWLVTGFKRNIDNMINFSSDLALIPDEIEAHPDFASAGEAYVNLGEVEFSGWEAQVALPINDSFLISASFTKTDARNKGSSLQLDRIPEEIAKAQLIWKPENSRFGGSVSMIWTGDVFQTVTGPITAYHPDLPDTRLNYGDYYVFDLAGHMYLDGDRKHKLTASVQNLLDEDYATRVNTGAVDAPSPVASRFLFEYRGVPQTFNLRYSFAFGG